MAKSSKDRAKNLTPKPYSGNFNKSQISQKPPEIVIFGGFAFLCG
jgi:hypothetical protein